MTSRRSLAAAAASALVAGTFGGAIPAASATNPAVRITPNPAYASTAFEGWGTSLAWFANATGAYPDEVRQDLLDKVFGEQGLNLNIARYNIGGGNATDVPSYLRPGGAVEGFWNPDPGISDAQGPITSTYADRERYAAAWDAENPAHYDFDADETQRWWMDALRNEITRWEAFSNSPPYFLTDSGFVSGGKNNPVAEQLATEDMDAFAGYLVNVVEHLEAEYGIDFESLEPFNEPSTSYWQSYMGSNGWPTAASRQEGARIGPERQAEMIEALAARLAEPGTTTDVSISAMDETDPQKFVSNWNGWTPEAKSLAGQLNVHTYGTTDRQRVRDIAKSSGKPLWMSEVEGDWDGTGFNLVNIDNGLGMAGRIVGDLRELEPSAWVLWQPVEDLYNMEKVSDKNWGSIFIDFDCNAEGNSERRIAAGSEDPSCKVLTNAKYNTIRNFTHYIHPGDRLIPTDNVQTTAAIPATGDALTLVHVNDSSSPRDLTIDLARFASIAPGATVTPIVTTQSPVDDPTANALREGTSLPVDGETKTAVVSIPAKSVTTLVVEGVSGVADTAPALHDGHSYQLRGVQSGKVLNADATALTIRASGATPTAVAAQTWTVRSLSGEGTDRHRFALQAGDGRLLATSNGTTALSSASLESAASNPSLQWITSTTDGTSYSLLSVTGERVLGVTNQSTADGAAVVLSNSNGQAHQRWTLVDAEPSSAPETNLALASTASATFTESASYSVDRTKNGVTTDKGWSNWRPSGKNAEDTLTYTFANVEKVQHAKISFYKDGATNSWAESVTVQYRNAAGDWTSLAPVSVPTPANGTAPVIEVPLGGVDTDSVRVVLTAPPAMYMIVSEVELFASAAALPEG